MTYWAKDTQIDDLEDNERVDEGNSKSVMSKDGYLYLSVVQTNLTRTFTGCPHESRLHWKSTCSVICG